MLLLASGQGQASLSHFQTTPAEDEGDAGDTEKDGEHDECSPDGPEKSVLIYVRVSTNEQEKEGHSIDSQIEELTSIIDRSPDIEQYREPIRDEGETGTDFDRDGIQQVARLAQRNDVTHLMVDTIDRIGRSVAETLMFIHELREKFDVKVMTRSRELDVGKPTDRLQVTMKATMADFGTRNRARSSKRSSADNFIKNKQWHSWYNQIPFGYEAADTNASSVDDNWIQRVDALEPVIEDIYTAFIDTEKYTTTAERVNDTYEELLTQCDGLEGDSLSSNQVKSIVTRPVYQGEPTIPVTDLEHYEPFPSVQDPELQFVTAEMGQRARDVASEIAAKYSTDDDLVLDPDDYPEKFDPYIIESVSPPVRLVCPDCRSSLNADGHQRKLDGRLGSRLYQCSNDDCEYSRRWPREAEYEMMEMLSALDSFHSLV